MGKITKQPTGFTQVANTVLHDPKLSWKAKGVYAYLYSKPDGWQFATKRIADEAADGYESTLSALQELEKAGYIKRERSGDGRVNYHLLATVGSEKPTNKVAAEPHPQSGNPIMGTLDPQSGNPTVGKPHSGKTRLLSNKEGEVIKIENNKDISEQGSLAATVSEVIKLFELVDPKNKGYYGNTTQRSAAEFLVKEYGFEDVAKRIQFLPKSNKARWFPTITTPVQLRDKWVQLEHAVERYREIETQRSDVLFIK